jgi:hypothetical protein
MPISTHGLPSAAAISRSGAVLYVTPHTAPAIDVIDLASQIVVNKVTLVAKPEVIAVGADERVLVSTIGTGGHPTKYCFVTIQARIPRLRFCPSPPPSGKQFQAARGTLRASVPQ